MNASEPWLTDLIDQQTKAELQRSYLAVTVIENRLAECKGKVRKPRQLLRRHWAAVRQFKYLVHRAMLDAQITKGAP